MLVLLFIFSVFFPLLQSAVMVHHTRTAAITGVMTYQLHMYFSGVVSGCILLMLLL